MTRRPRRTQKNPFNSLNNGSMSEILKHLNVRNRVRLGATTRRHGPGIRADMVAITRLRGAIDKAALQAAAAITRAIAQWRRETDGPPRGPYHQRHRHVEIKAPVGTFEVRITISNFNHSRNVFCSFVYKELRSFASQLSELKIERGQYRLVPAGRMGKWENTSSPSKFVLLKHIHKRAIELYHQRPVAAWA